jgi:hypothetical protein
MLANFKNTTHERDPMRKRGRGLCLHAALTASQRTTSREKTQKRAIILFKEGTPCILFCVVLRLFSGYLLNRFCTSRVAMMTVMLA